MQAKTQNKITVAVALSGGLDSLMAAWLLKEQGYEVIGVHARFIPKAGSDHGLQTACDFLKIPLHILDLQEAFKKEVIEPFIQTYLQAKTPNPCALCNPALKFGLLMDEASGLGANFLATGHYARLGQFQPEPLNQLSTQLPEQLSAQLADQLADQLTEQLSGQLPDQLPGQLPCQLLEEAGSTPRPQSFWTIFPAQDPEKDQSYFLALVPPRRLERVIFPLYNQEKHDLRALAQKLGIPVPEPKESQEICFVPGDDYRAFLQNSGYSLPTGGPMRLLNGSTVGHHKGLWQYTEGQRRGLGIAAPAPLYVISKDVANNTLVVGPKEYLASYECEATRLNFFVPYQYWPKQVMVRVRYRQKAVPAQVAASDFEPGSVESRMHITFNQAQDPPAKGQLAVVYHPEGFILAGGIIC